MLYARISGVSGCVSVFLAGFTFLKLVGKGFGWGDGRRLRFRVGIRRLRLGVGGRL